MTRLKSGRRVALLCQVLEARFAPANLIVPLDPLLDLFGDQIAAFQAYGDAANLTFSIFDTGASAITFSPADQEYMQIPIAYPGGAIAGGIGGIITGDISAPGTVFADGIHLLDEFFDFTLDPDAAAAAPGVQAFVGTLDGSPHLPTITGTPILNSSASHPNGLAAKINMQGFILDLGFGDDLTFPLPDLHFVEPGTVPEMSADSTEPVYVPLDFFGGDNHTNPGDQITETQSPTQNDVSLVYQDAALGVGGMNFLFDTGAQLSIVSTSLALQLGIDLDHPETTIAVQGVGGAMEIPGYTFDELVLPTTDGGTITFTNVPIFVLDVAPDLDGILGMNLFGTANSFVYDPFNAAGSRLGITFHTTPRDVIDDEFWDIIGGGFPFFAGLMNGHSIPAFDISSLPSPVETTTTLTATPNASTGGTLVTFVAMIAPSPGDLGTVTFKDNGLAIVAGTDIAVLDGVATFQISTLTTGNHSMSAAYSGAVGFGESESGTLTQVVATAPHVLSVTPNGNISSLSGNQRSRVASLVVVFDQAVSLDADAMALALHANGVALSGVAQPDGYGSLPDSLVLSTTDNVTWIVTFVGNTDPIPVLDGISSITDGVYDLNIDATKVHPAGVLGVSMAGNSTFAFHRLFGDSDAPEALAAGEYQAIVSIQDNFSFRGSFNSTSNYKASLDADGDGSINILDNFQFRSRFNKPLTWRI